MRCMEFPAIQNFTRCTPILFYHNNLFENFAASLTGWLADWLTWHQKYIHTENIHIHMISHFIYANRKFPNNKIRKLFACFVYSSICMWKTQKHSQPNRCEYIKLCASCLCLWSHHKLVLWRAFQPSVCSSSCAGFFLFFFNRWLETSIVSMCVFLFVVEIFFSFISVLPKEKATCWKANWNEGKRCKRKMWARWKERWQSEMTRRIMSSRISEFKWLYEVCIIEWD